MSMIAATGGVYLWECYLSTPRRIPPRLTVAFQPSNRSASRVST